MTSLEIVPSKNFEISPAAILLACNAMLIPFPHIQRVMNKLTSSPPDYSLIFIFALVYLAAYLFCVVKKFQTDDL